jgi:hypothetical protein
MLKNMNKITAFNYSGIVFDVEEVDGLPVNVIPLFS